MSDQMNPADRLRDAARVLRDGGRTLMEEDVALALADWLTKEATLSEAFTPREALAVADAVLGDEILEDEISGEN